jgi:alpha-mannosidase
MIKLSVPGVLKEKYLGQGMFGTEELIKDGGECVSQQWTATVGEGKMLTLINNGVYGSSYEDGEIRASLLRSAGYTAHPIFDRTILPQDRFSPRIDQGERIYRFVLEGGTEAERTENVSRQAQEINEAPYALSFFPADGDGKNTQAALLEGEGVQLTAMRPSQDGKSLIVRLFESTGKARKAKISLPLLKAEAEVELGAFEIRTLKIDLKSGAVEEANLLD